MTCTLGDTEALQRMAASGPLENLFLRVSLPEDVAATIVFLCLKRGSTADRCAPDAYRWGCSVSWCTTAPSSL